MGIKLGKVEKILLFVSFLLDSATGSRKEERKRDVDLFPPSPSHSPLSSSSLPSSSPYSFPSFSTSFSCIPPSLRVPSSSPHLINHLCLFSAAPPPLHFYVLRSPSIPLPPHLPTLFHITYLLQGVKKRRRSSEGRHERKSQ